MCTQVVINNRMVDTQGALKHVLGSDTLVLDWNYDERGLDDNACLCPIDIKATAYKHGYNSDDSDPIYTKLSRTSDEAGE